MGGNAGAVESVLIAVHEHQEPAHLHDGTITTQFAIRAISKETRDILVPFAVKLIERPHTGRW